MANTKSIKPRHLEAEGKRDYDYVNDILFFKLKDREYYFSSEFQNIVIDVDEEKFVVGIQIFNASKFLRLSKMNLREIPKWQFKARVEEGIIELRLNYQLQIRNKVYEKSPIIIQENKSKIPSPQMVQTI